MDVDGREITVTGDLLQPLIRRTSDIFRLVVSAMVLIVVVVNLIGAILRFTIDSFVVGALVAVLFWIVGQIVTIGVINTWPLPPIGKKSEIRT